MGEDNFLTPFQGISKAINFKIKDYYIDNFAFQLHYKFTVLTFLVGVVLVSAQQYIGEHIKCISDKGVEQKVAETFCFFTSTFTVDKHMNETLLNMHYLAHPGVGPYGLQGVNQPYEPITKHAYYQWVPFVLFGQGLMFYATHFLWKKVEGGRIKSFTEGLKRAEFAFSKAEVTKGDKKIPSTDKKDEVINLVKKTFDQQVKYNIHTLWALKLIFFEVLNVFHIVLQFYITDKFLQGQFWDLGVNIINKGLESTIDPLDEVFPKVTKCNFHKYGPSGSIQSHDVMCVMALNIINEKIYTFLWFWLIVLFIISILAVVWRFVCFFMHAKSKLFNKLAFGMLSLRKDRDPWSNLSLTKKSSFGDWLFLKYLSNNLDTLIFAEILLKIADYDEADKVETQPLYTKNDNNPFNMIQEIGRAHV